MTVQENLGTLSAQLEGLRDRIQEVRREMYLEDSLPHADPEEIDSLQKELDRLKLKERKLDTKYQEVLNTLWDSVPGR